MKTAAAFAKRPLIPEGPDLSEPLLDCVVVEPKAPARAAVIWLHGLGADGHDFEPIVPELGLDPAAAVRFVFPHAPAIPVTVNGGFVMPAWYDIVDFDLNRRHDRAGLDRSRRQVVALIERERARGIAAERIVLAGFSQGGAVAIDTAVRLPYSLGGLMALSTYMLFADELEKVRRPEIRDLPVFIGHGTMDPVVAFQLGKEARKRFESWGSRVTWGQYPMAHAVCAQEIADVGVWLADVLGD